MVLFNVDSQLLENLYCYVPYMITATYISMSEGDQGDVHSCKSNLQNYVLILARHLIEYSDSKFVTIR